MMTKEITGRHVLIGTVAAFGVIVAVNFTMAFMAVGTFPGLEVKNSYVASQSFEARRTAQDALGWHVSAEADAELLKLTLTDADGAPATPASLQAFVGRSTVARDDQILTFTQDGDAWHAPVALESGQWVLKLTAESADGVLFHKRINLWIR